jgi:hypothetical protein
MHSPFLWRTTAKATSFPNRCKDDIQALFDLRDKPTSPKTVTTPPTTTIQIDLSVAEPVKNREMSELVESYALMPMIRRMMPPARIANEIALVMDIPSM